MMPEHEKQNLALAPWRCPGDGPFPQSDDMPPLPPMNELMADSLKWGPLGARWGRAAHWPLMLGIGHKRDRNAATQIRIAQTVRREATERATHERMETPALAGGTEQ